MITMITSWPQQIYNVWLHIIIYFHQCQSGEGSIVVTPMVCKFKNVLQIVEMLQNYNVLTGNYMIFKESQENLMCDKNGLSATLLKKL